MSLIGNFMMRPTVGDKNDVKMEETKGEENGSDWKHAVDGLPLEEVPQPDLDSFK
jgi:hypothetical protein